MAGEWHPMIGRRLLSGVSARGLSAAGNWCLGVGMVCLVVGLVLLWIADQPILAAVCVLPGALGVTAGRALDGFAGTREAREHTAGYATLVPGTGPADVEHVDPRTGRLVSFAGEDLTEAERRARVAAIRADVRLGVDRRGRVPASTAGEITTEDRDEALFAGRPRTFVTLPWSVRNSVVWGWFLVVLAPLGFFVVALLASDERMRPAAPVTFGAVLATAALAGVGLIVAMRRADRILVGGTRDAAHGRARVPGDGPISRGLVTSAWITVFGLALPLAAGSLYGAHQSVRLAELRSDGVRVTAHDAETSSGLAGRNIKVRAVVDYADGARQVRLDHDQDPAQAAVSARTWTEAPAPYDGTFTVVHHSDDPDFVVAETDLAGAGSIATEADLGRAAILSAGWGVPWFVAWLVLTLRAPGGRRAR